MKRFLCLILSLLLLAPFCTALATSEARCVIGADLSETEIAAVYESFGFARGSVAELTLTNSEERELLSGLVEESVIGSKSISCVYIEQLSGGSGYEIVSRNVNWCSEEMYKNALITAGLSDVKVIVAAPFEVSGTAALAGIYKAYEDMTGEKLDDTAKEVGTRELVITGWLADEIGKIDAAGIVNELKLILDETRQMSDEELKTKIQSIAGGYNITLNDTQLSQLVMLCRQLEKLDGIALADKVRSVQDGIKKLQELQEKAQEGKEKAVGFWEKAQPYVQPVIDFIMGFFAKEQQS